MLAFDSMDPGFETTQATDQQFTDDELEQFESDDRNAGTAIAKILSTLFIYTALAMSIVVWWTFRTVAN